MDRLISASRSWKLWPFMMLEFTFSRKAKIPPVQIGIGTTLHEKSIFPATDRCQHHQDGRKGGRPAGSSSRRIIVAQPLEGTGLSSFSHIRRAKGETPAFRIFPRWALA